MDIAQPAPWAVPVQAQTEGIITPMGGMFDLNFDLHLVRMGFVAVTFSGYLAKIPPTINGLLSYPSYRLETVFYMCRLETTRPANPLKLALVVQPVMQASEVLQQGCPIRWAGEYIFLAYLMGPTSQVRSASNVVPPVTYRLTRTGKESVQVSYPSRAKSVSVLFIYDWPNFVTEAPFSRAGWNRVLHTLGCSYETLQYRFLTSFSDLPQRDADEMFMAQYEQESALISGRKTVDVFGKISPTITAIYVFFHR